MDTNGHLTVSQSTARKLPKAKPQRKVRSRTNGASQAPVEEERAQPAVGTLSRTKSLLLAALRVWELKQRVGE